jgi:hypothetical protein
MLARLLLLLPIMLSSASGQVPTYSVAGPNVVARLFAAHHFLTGNPTRTISTTAARMSAPSLSVCITPRATSSVVERAAGRAAFKTKVKKTVKSEASIAAQPEGAERPVKGHLARSTRG